MQTTRVLYETEFMSHNCKHQVPSQGLKAGWYVYELLKLCVCLWMSHPIVTFVSGFLQLQIPVWKAWVYTGCHWRVQSSRLKQLQHLLQHLKVWGKMIHLVLQTCNWRLIDWQRQSYCNLMLLKRLTLTWLWWWPSAGPCSRWSDYGLCQIWAYHLQLKNSERAIGTEPRSDHLEDIVGEDPEESDECLIATYLAYRFAGIWNYEWLGLLFEDLFWHNEFGKDGPGTTNTCFVVQKT